MGFSGLYLRVCKSGKQEVHAVNPCHGKHGKHMGALDAWLFTLVPSPPVLVMGQPDLSLVRVTAVSLSQGRRA